MNLKSQRVINWLALIVSLASVIVAYLISDRIYERMPHFEDEMAYVWQAQAVAGGDLVLPSPPNPKSFLTPFVIDYHGLRFSKYPPGWPTALAIGVFMRLRDWVNPFLAGLGIWLLYLLAKRITTPLVGLLTVGLMLTSPMFWLLSASLLSHAWSLVVALGFILAWLDTFVVNNEARKENQTNGFAGFVTQKPPKWLTVLVAGLSLGVLALTRPITAVGVGLPFFIHGLILLVRGDKSTRIRVLWVGVIASLVGLLIFAWQFSVTGNPLLNPYTLWWKYDKIGFGVGYGRYPEGHNWTHAWFNIRHSLSSSGTGGDLLGWGDLWWLFLPFGLWALRRKPAAWLVASIFPSLLLVYIPYWIGSWQYGPRYYYEGMVSLVILSAAGLVWLAGNGMKVRKVLAGLALAILVGSNLFAYLPGRLWSMHDMYNINRSMLAPFATAEAQEITPALIIVHIGREWTEYGGLLELQDAQLNTPFIFALYRIDAEMDAYRKAFPERGIYDYYPLTMPFEFFPAK